MCCFGYKKPHQIKGGVYLILISIYILAIAHQAQYVMEHNHETDIEA